jgi:hypothetical protein
VFYNGGVLSAIVVVECNIGIVGGSLPSIKPLLSRLFPKMLDSTRSGTNALAGSQNFPFQNLNAHANFSASVSGGIRRDNESEENIIPRDEGFAEINKMTEVVIGYSKE